MYYNTHVQGHEDGLKTPFLLGIQITPFYNLLIEKETWLQLSIAYVPTKWARMTWEHKYRYVTKKVYIYSSFIPISQIYKSISEALWLL